MSETILSMRGIVKQYRMGDEIQTVLRGIARCIAQSASPDGMARLMRDYSVMVSEELEEAV